MATSGRLWFAPPPPSFRYRYSHSRLELPLVLRVRKLARRLIWFAWVTRKRVLFSFGSEWQRSEPVRPVPVRLQRKNRSGIEKSAFLHMQRDKWMKEKKKKKPPRTTTAITTRPSSRGGDPSSPTSKEPQRRICYLQPLSLQKPRPTRKKKRCPRGASRAVPTSFPH